MAVAHRGAISFGLVHIPVGIYTATQDNDIHFNQLCKEDGSRVRYKKVCSNCGKEVSSGDIVRGFEYEKGKYVTLTDEEFEKAKSEKDRTIHILHFADLKGIRPIYFDKTDHAVPDSGILIETLFFADEIRQAPKEPARPELKEEELTMAKSLISTMVQEFEPEKYHDEYQTRIWEIIRQKIQGEAFDSPDYIYELKLDGIRCIAYLDENGTDLRNKRDMRLLEKVPELGALHQMVKGKCILDGELAVIRDGRTDFFEIQKRVMTGSSTKIKLASQRCPACFTAFDILYYEDQETTFLPLMERKEMLASVVLQENAQFAISRYIEERGRDFFDMTGACGLEGIVAKKKDSRYYFDRRTRDWIKIKNMEDDDFVICGYIYKENNMVSLVLGQYEGKTLVYKGHVTLGVSRREIGLIEKLRCNCSPFLEIPKGNENAVWVRPEMVCTVEYMSRTENGGYRQPVFKGIREDKTAKE